MTHFSNAEIVSLEETVATAVEDVIAALNDIQNLAANTGIGADIASLIKTKMTEQQDTMTEIKGFVEKLRSGVETKNADAVKLGQNLDSLWS